MGKKVPAIRFKGFTEDWEQRKMKELNEINPKSVLPEIFEYVDLESVVGTTLITTKLQEKKTAPSRAQRLANRGDVFFQTVRPYQKNNYLFDLPHNNYVFSTGYAQLRPKIDSYFLLNLLQEEKFVSKVIDRCTGTSYPAINSEDLAQITVGITLSREEQTKIGDFFKTLDQTTALLQQKIDALQQLKKGFLQKMFPAGQEKVPRLRFAGFTEEWVQRELKSMSKMTLGGGTPKTKVEEYWKGKIPWIQSSDLILNDLLSINPTKFISEEALNSSAAKLIPGNSIAIVTRVGVGKLVYVPFQYSTSQDFLSLVDLNVNHWFAAYGIYKLLQKEKDNTQGTSIKGITKDNLLSTIISYPILTVEQEKIGLLFKNIDDIIALLHQKVEHLQTIKKGLLQKMFI